MYSPLQEEDGPHVPRCIERLGPEVSAAACLICLAGTLSTLIAAHPLLTAGVNQVRDQFLVTRPDPNSIVATASTYPPGAVTYTYTPATRASTTQTTITLTTTFASTLPVTTSSAPHSTIYKVTANVGRDSASDEATWAAGPVLADADGDTGVGTSFSTSVAVGLGGRTTTNTAEAHRTPVISKSSTLGSGTSTLASTSSPSTSTGTVARRTSTETSTSTVAPTTSPRQSTSIIEAHEGALKILHFPLSFEEDSVSKCPKGWTCRGDAQVCNPHEKKECTEDGLQGIDGFQYLTVGHDFEMGIAISPNFVLPKGTDKVSFKRSGGANAGSGFYVHRVSDGNVLCRAESGKNTNYFFHDECSGLARYGGKPVYIRLRDMQSGPWGKVLIDDIRLQDAHNEDILEAQLVGSHDSVPSHGDDVVLKEDPKDFDWIIPPNKCCQGDLPTIITYTGKDKQAYIDGGVMLGLSLQRFVPKFPRICLVVKTMSEVNKKLLRVAGWNLIEVDNWHPSNEHFAFDYWWDVYDKINIFRVKVKKLLWMDADMYVWDSKLSEILTGQGLKPGQIGMVKDCAQPNYNSGLMLFEPKLATYRDIRESMKSERGWDGLDQPIINIEYSGHIVELDKKFNTHGNLKPCKGVVVAHYTGRNKPTLANVANLQRVRDGYRDVPYSLRCPNLYKDYYCEMKRDASYLSVPMQAALKNAGGDCL